VTALASELPPPYELLVLTLAYRGIRFGEAAGLRRRFVRPDDRLLVVASSLSAANGVLSMDEPKAHQHRMVTLPAFLADGLADHIARLEFDAPEQLVFTSPGGFPIRHQNFRSRLWYPACGRAGVSATPHALRASHATWLDDAGWSPVEIAARLGHDKATVTTKHYARRVVGRDVEIASGLDSTFRGTSSERSGHAVGTEHRMLVVEPREEE
jgi:integrase